MQDADFILEGAALLRDRQGKIEAHLKPGSWTVLLKRDPLRLLLPARGADQAKVVAVPRRAELLFSLLTDNVADELRFTQCAHGPADDAMDLNGVVRDLELSSLLHRRLHELSGGEKARVAIAVALLAQPSLLVLQDTLAAVDSERRGRLCRAVQNHGVSVLEVRGTPLEPDSPAESVILADGQQIAILSPEDYWLASPALQLSAQPLRHQVESAVRLTVHGLSFQYAGDFRLSPVDLQAGAGRIVRITGPNGAGKTTLMKSLAQLLLPDRGTVELNAGGATVRLSYPATKRKRGLSRWLLYQFQDPDHQIYCATVRGELMETARHAGGLRNSPDEVASELGLKAFLETSPWDLSEGQRRLLTLGSILCAAPPVLLADEPTAQLDWVQRETVLRALRRYADQGGTCLYVAHDEPFNEALGASTLRLPFDGRVVHGSCGDLGERV